MVISNSGQGKTPEEGEHDDAIEQDQQDQEQEQEQELEEELEEETILIEQLGHIPGRLPRGWDQGLPIPGGKEISLDHATDAEWQRFLDSLDEEE